MIPLLINFITSRNKRNIKNDIMYQRESPSPSLDVFYSEGLSVDSSLTKVNGIFIYLQGSVISFWSSLKGRYLKGLDSTISARGLLSSFLSYFSHQNSEKNGCLLISSTDSYPILSLGLTFRRDFIRSTASLEGFFLSNFEDLCHF